MPTRLYLFNHHIKILEGNNFPLDEAAISRLKERNFPPIINWPSFALLIGVSQRIVWNIIKRKPEHYREFQLKQKNGKVRNILAPRTYLKVLQWWILENILENVLLPDYVQGFTKKKSIITNAQMHFGAKHILNIDIKDFFPSINMAQCVEMFMKLGYSEDVSILMSEICTYNDALPQGAPTSPAIANIVFLDTDAQLNSLAISRGYKYSRYADDITFSSITTPIPQDIINTSITSIINRAGFKLNSRKTRFMGRGSRMEITGLVINEKIQMPLQWRKKVRAIYHQAILNPKVLSEKEYDIYGYQGILKGLSQTDTKLYKTGEQLIQLIEQSYSLNTKEKYLGIVTEKWRDFIYKIKARSQ